SDAGDRGRGGARWWRGWCGPRVRHRRRWRGRSLWSHVCDGHRRRCAVGERRRDVRCRAHDLVEARERRAHGRRSVVGRGQRERIEGIVQGRGRGRLLDHRCFRDGRCHGGWWRGRGGGIVSPIDADGCAALTALDRDYLARHPPVVDVVRHREAVATLGANDGPGHRPVAYTAAALMASKFWVMHGAMKPVSRGRKEVRSRYPSGAWLLACWLVALPVHADPPGADLSSRPRSGPDMLADLGADSAPPTKDPRAHAVSADAPHDAHDHPSADEPDDVDDVDDPIEDPLFEHSLPNEGSDDAEDSIEDPPPDHEDDATDDDVVDVDGADRADDGASPSTALPDPEARHPKAKLYGDPRPPGVRGVPMGTTRYTRTGLHLRANLGLGYLHIFNSSSAHLGDDAFSAEDAAVAALPLDLELWAGGALTRDLALNLVIRSGQASGGKLHATPDTLDLKGGLTTAFLGAGLLYHLDPARGWLVGLAAGF